MSDALIMYNDEWWVWDLSWDGTGSGKDLEAGFELL